ncbi:uncharacterized protein LOC114741003 isoform X2 [Neltuma alba]|uniref:uncharacterized protein LOC114741003 isoform X2 n=1 Tax=Neltuma alba TaxID=207710 RepID=UPI0010A2DB0E|nr:uncharacterized protein LOC114741003 isoform X2 [Prosopis alba]
MEAEDLLKLYDSCWFEVEILKEIPNSIKSTSSEENPEDQIEEKQIPDSPRPKLSRIETIHTRSMSDSLTSFKFGSFSPDTVLLAPSKLQTILSGKEATDRDPEIEPPKQMTLHVEDLPSKKKRDIRRRMNKKERKSLSDLEFEELKGFMDLGFVFSEKDKDSNLASIIPGLQRLGKKDADEEDEGEEEQERHSDDSEISRPYLSEAWEFQERRRKKENNQNRNPFLMNWRVPSSNNEIDVKDSLKLWAHNVASTVR